MRQITCDLIFQRWGWDNTQPIHPRCEKKGEAQLETIRCRTSTKKTQTSFETMNSMIMSSRKALVAKPTQSRRVASKATRRPVAMAGMQVRRVFVLCLFVCVLRRGGADRARRGESGRERRGDPVLSLSLLRGEGVPPAAREIWGNPTSDRAPPREPLVPPSRSPPALRTPRTRRRLDEKTNPPLSLHTHYNRSSSLRRGTSAFPTSPLSPTTRSPGRSTTSSATDGLHASSSPARRRPTPTSSSSPALLSTRTGTGPCGSSPCSDASPEMRFSPRSRTARTSTQDTGSGLSDSTTSGSARWPASSAGSKLFAFSVCEPV